MLRLVLGATIAAFAVLQVAAQSLPYPLSAFQGPAYEGFPCQAFQPNPDGSWTVVQFVTIPAENGLIELSPGVTFTRRVAFGNLDLVALVERKCR